MKESFPTNTKNSSCIWPLVVNAQLKVDTLSYYLGGASSSAEREPYRTLKVMLFENDVTITGHAKKQHTPWKTNMELKYGGLEDDVPFQLGDFWVPC